MQLLADENIHTSIVAWLRAAGHDVVWAAESHRRESDRELLRIAREQHRIVLTSDLDFGELIYRQRLVSSGIVLLRLHRLSVERRLELLAARWAMIEARSPGHFVVVSQRKIRVRPLGPGSG